MGYWLRMLAAVGVLLGKTYQQHCSDLPDKLRDFCLSHFAKRDGVAGASSAARSTGGPFSGRSLQQASALCGSQGYIIGQSYCVTIRKLLTEFAADLSS